MTKTAVSRFCAIVKVIRFCAGFCGTDVSDPNYRMWALTYVVITSVIFFFACTLYTIYVGVVLNNDWTIILQAFAVAASAIQGLTKLLTCVANASLMRNIQGTYESIYKEYEGKDGEYTKYLHKRINTFWNLMVAFIWVYTSLVTFMICYPLFHFVAYNQKLMVLHFLVPGIDHNSDSGHLMLITLHIMCLIFGAFGNFGGDMYLFLFIINVPLLKDIFRVKFEELNELVLQNDKYEEMHSIFWELLAWHQKYVKILHGTKKVFKTVMFVQLSTACVSILCTISCMFMKVWPSAPAYLMYSFIVLYTFCGLGTIVENTNEHFTNEIYSTLLWYELPVKEQKIVILMLAKSQNELVLTAADVLPLSMATALQLTKGIYSFSMMLITYL
ncbi:odorant receptor 67d [Drosophila novamexicana]|uniref:odorant receptor 67d n=1 Tax=Drosophila novamexicana TaxID=47314 RepID=UPI0011E59B9D|nr:odorant receptor 67d [Drosophila novamexicana]